MCKISQMNKICLFGVKLMAFKAPIKKVFKFFRFLEVASIVFLKPNLDSGKSFALSKELLRKLSKAFNL